jgi:hypothetical protein
LLTIVALTGCHSPEYQKYIDQQEQWASTGSESTGTAPPDPGHDTSEAEASAGAEASAEASTDESTEGTGSGGGDETTGDGTSNEPGETTASATTTEPDPVCGDGVVDPKSEECDDGLADPEGACSLFCQRSRLIFVTSIRINGKMSGLQGADAYCKSQALKAQMADPASPIVDANNFKALLPSSTETIFGRHFHGKGPYRLVNGLKVSDSFTELFTEPLKNPINVDEFGQTQITSVWTASLANGSPYPGVDFCGNWTGTKGSASKGRSEYTDAWWIEVSTEVAGQPTTDCAYDWALYCVEQ